MSHQRALIAHGSSLIRCRTSSHVPRPTSIGKLSNDRGIALITVIIIMLTMALIGASLAELSSSVNFSVDTIMDETKARYLAEAGIAHALSQLRAGGTLENSVDEEGNPVQYPLGDGVYMVTFEPSEALITCTGLVNGVKKTLLLQYNVF